MQILYIEDYQEEAALIQQRLLSRFEVKWVGTVADAERALKGGAFDLILTDLRLPGSRGAETIRRLKVFALPIFVLSGSTDDEFFQEAFQSEVADYVSKASVLKIDLAGRIEAAYARFHRSRPARKLSFVNLDSLKPFITCQVKPRLVCA